MKRSLDRREQAGFVIGMTALIMVVLFAFYIPAGPRRAWLQSKLDLEAAQKDIEIQKLVKMDEAKRLAKQKQLMEKLDNRAADFSLFTFVDGLLNSTGLRNRAQLEQFKTRHISSRQPMVQLRLEGVSFDELVNLLHQASNGDNLVSVYKLDTLKPTATGKGLDCDITFVTLTPGGSTGGEAAPAAPDTASGDAPAPAAS